MNFLIYVTVLLPTNMSTFQYGQSTQRESAPTLVDADMDNKLESGSCALAKAFYEKHGAEASQISDRRELGRLFASKQNELLQDETLRATCTKNGREDPRRHWSQVLDSLVRDGKVLKVRDGGSWVDWNTVSRKKEECGYTKINFGNFACFGGMRAVAGPYTQEALRIAELIIGEPDLLEEMELGRLSAPSTDMGRARNGQVGEVIDGEWVSGEDVDEDEDEGLTPFVHAPEPVDWSG